MNKLKFEKINKKSHLNLNFRTKQYRMKEREKWQIIFIENYNV